MDQHSLLLNLLVAEAESERPKLFEQYHENTKLHPENMPQTGRGQLDPNRRLTREVTRVVIEEMESVIATGGKKYALAQKHALPHALDSIETVRFKDVLLRRKSSQRFNRSRLSSREIGVLCEATYGWNAKQIIRDAEGEIGFRYVPSAGRLYPLELYLLIPSSKAARQCKLTHYAPDDHALQHLQQFSESQLSDCFIDYPQPSPALVVFLTGVPARLTWKYGERSYRYVLLEAGHAGQNLQLAAAALGLDSCPIVGFYDDRVHDLLDVDGVSEILLYSLFVGHPNRKSVK